MERVRPALPWIYGVAIAWLNAYLVKHVFTLTFTGAMHSMHGFWMALGRVMGDSWWRPQWVPNWAGGMPAELTYSPMVPWLSWHFGLYAVLAGAFVAGPVALYWMASQITGKPGWSFIAGVAYSLVSPTELIQPDAAFAWMRFLEPRRMYLTVVWDEAPHHLALAFVCVAVGSWSRGWRGVAVGAIALAALANPFGVTGAGLCGLCWAIANADWKLVPGTGFLAYLIVCPFYPPSLFTVLKNNGALAPESSWNNGSWLGLAIVAAGVLALRRFGFFALLAWVMTALPVLYYRWDLHFLQQPGRYKSEMELALVLLVVFAAERLLRERPRWLLAGLAVIGIVAAQQQIVRHRKFARNGIKQADPEATIEAHAAQAARGYVYAPGSIAHWMNAFAPVRQYTGGSYATSPNTVQQRLTLDLAGEKSPEKFTQWMQAVGVDAVFISGRQSPEFWKPFATDALAGHLPVLWEERDTRLYEVPRVRRTQAHAVPALLPLGPYVKAIEDPASPDIEVRWRNTGQATITGAWRPADMVLVHMNWHPDWRAYVQGTPAGTGADGLGQLVIVPKAAGPIELIYKPSWTTRYVSLFGIILTVLWVWSPRRFTLWSDTPPAPPGSHPAQFLANRSQ